MTLRFRVLTLNETLNHQKNVRTIAKAETDAHVYSSLLNGHITVFQKRLFSFAE